MRRPAAADGGVPPQQQQRGTGHRRVMIMLIESHINYNNRENSRNLDSSTGCSGHDGPRLPRSPRSKGHPPWDNVILERVSFSRVAFMANMAVFFDEQLRELHSTTRRVEPCPPSLSAPRRVLQHGAYFLLQNCPIASNFCNNALIPVPALNAIINVASFQPKKLILRRTHRQIAIAFKIRILRITKIVIQPVCIHVCAAAYILIE
jgi:hypothetical protein